MDLSLKREKNTNAITIMKNKKEIIIKNIELKNEILNILNSSDMWTYLMDSYHFPEDKETEKILQKDFDKMINKIIQKVVKYYEKS